LLNKRIEEKRCSYRFVLAAFVTAMKLNVLQEAAQAVALVGGLKSSPDALVTPGRLSAWTVAP
jgi:hypothetical protein